MNTARVQTDFSTGKVSRLIIKLSLPIIAAEFVHILYNIVDRMYIGHMPGDGTAALTGIGVALPLITLISAFANLCGSGGAPLAAIARGEGDNERAVHIMQTSFTMLLIAGAVLTAVLYFVSPWALGILGGDEETLPYALTYFRIYVLGSVPVMISLGMNPFINSQGFSRIGMLTVIIGAVLNIVLDPIFIFVLGLGTAGAAIATVISQAASAVWVVVFLCSRRPVMRLTRLEISLPQLRSVMRLGLTGFTFKVTNSVTQAVINITLKLWGGAASTLYVGAMSIVNSLREVIFLPCNGMMNGAQPVISYNYGAKEYARVSESIGFAMKINMLINTVLWSLIMLMPETAIRIFTPDAELVDVSVLCVRAFFATFPLMALQSVGQNTFVAINAPKRALFFSLLRKIILVVPLTVALPYLGLGAIGAFWAEPVSELIGSVACFTTMYLTVWRKLKVLAKAQEQS